MQREDVNKRKYDSIVIKERCCSSTWNIFEKSGKEPGTSGSEEVWGLSGI